MGGPGNALRLLRMDDGLARRAVEINWRNLALGHDVFEADGATFVRNVALPGIYDANFVFEIRVSEPGDIEQLLARAAREYLHAARLTFRVSPFTSPLFEARLALEGYEREEALVMLLDGPLRRATTRFDIRPIEDDAAWRAYTELKCLDWSEQAPRHNHDPADMTIPFGLAASSRLKCPPIRYVLAYDDGRAIGYCNGWEGHDGVGQVEDLFVHPAYRRRGIATALIHESVASARSRGAGPMVIVADPRDTPKQAYAALGWQPLAICRQYGKTLVGGPESTAQAG
jgi:ribosomal protein S18 acetylase RimI-like enzyme